MEETLGLTRGKPFAIFVNTKQHHTDDPEFSGLRKKGEGTMALLTAMIANAKTAKDQSAVSAIQHLPPYTKSGANFWGVPVIDGDKSDLRFNDPKGVVVGVRSKGKAKKTDSSKPCWMYCLDESGRGVFDNVQEARQKRAALFLKDRPAYKAKLVKEIKALERKAKRENKRAAVRLNGTSDLRWERIFPELFGMFPDVQFYDYTKVPERVTPDNYHLTFSLQFVRSGEAS